MAKNNPPNFFSRLILKRASALALLLAAGIFYLFPFEVQAAPSAETPFASVYWEQLERYMRDVARFKEEQERLQREERLKKALISYVVKRGDNLTKIAAQYGTDVDSLIAWNGLLNPHLIYPGQKLDILTIEGTLHKVNRGETLDSIAAKYKIEAHVIAAFNLLGESPRLNYGEKLVIPGGELPPEEKRAARALLLASRSGNRNTPLPSVPPPSFSWPVRGEITSPFGPRHNGFHYGVDIAVPFGTYVRASASGTVSFTGYLQGYGLVLEIDHGSGWSTLYAHNSRLLVREQEEVTAGQTVALVGASGNATGPHLHFEVIYKGRKYDPLLFLP